MKSYLFSFQIGIGPSKKQNKFGLETDGPAFSLVLTKIHGFILHLQYMARPSPSLL